jgi:hypothetical protein
MSFIFLLLKISFHTGYRWLTPVILATQEAEIRRIKIRRQPWQNSSTRPYVQKPLHKESVGEVTQGEGPEFKHQFWKKKKSFHLF